MHIIPGWKIQKMVKKSWLSVKKMWIWCEKYQKKFGLNWRFPWRAPAKTCSLVFGSAICPLHVICKAICGPKKFHPVCLTFDPLGLQMTIIAQNDRNYLKIKNLCIEKIFQLKMDQFWPNLQLPKFKIKRPADRAKCHQIQKNGPNHLFVCQYPCFKEWVRLFCDFRPRL